MPVVPHRDALPLSFYRHRKPIHWRVHCLCPATLLRSTSQARLGRQNQLGHHRQVTSESGYRPRPRQRIWISWNVEKKIWNQVLVEIAAKLCKSAIEFSCKRLRSEGAIGLGVLGFSVGFLCLFRAYRHGNYTKHPWIIMHPYALPSSSLTILIQLNPFWL